MRRRRKISVRKGRENRREERRMAGERARRKGLAISRRVASVRVDEAVCI
jgi:hypothetical protein